MKHLFLFLILGLLSITVFAQKTISGKVVVEETNEALVGVNIAVQGISIGTTTDADGQFQITLAEDQNELIFTYIGCADYSLKVDKPKQNLLVELQCGASVSIDEIVVTALGLERSSKDLGYAIQSLDSEEISSIKSPNLGEISSAIVFHRNSLL